MKTLLSLVCIIFCLHLSTLVTAQNFDWAKVVVPGPANGDNNNGKDIAVDEQYNVYTVGVVTYSPSAGPIDLNPGTGIFSVNQSGTYVTKLDSAGNFVWAKFFPSIQSVGGSVIENIAIDQTGNVILGGSYTGAIDFDPGPGTDSSTTTGYDFFILKLSAGGNFIWVKTMPALTAYMLDLTIDAQNNILFCGYFQGQVDMDPDTSTAILYSFSYNAFMVKLTNNGSLVWAKNLGNGSFFSESSASGIKTDSSGQVYVSGSFGNWCPLDFDPGPDTLLVSASGQGDGYILRLSANGDFDWVRKFGGIGYTVPSSIALDNNGMIYTAGAFDRTAYFANATDSITLTSSGSYDVLIAKLTNTGDFLWAKSVGRNDSIIGQGGHNIAVDSIGNVYTLGYFKDSVDFDPGPGVALTTVQTFYTSSRSLFLLKLDTDGNYIRVRTTNGGQDIFCKSLALDNSANLYFTGYFRAHPLTIPIDFDPDTSSYTFVSHYPVIFTLKWSQCNAGTSYQNVSACSSYIWNNITYDSSGTYSKSMTTSTGCDSLAVLNLTISSPVAVSQNINLCNGQSYTINNQTYTQTGVYVDTLSAQNGCDSTVTTNLYVDSTQAQVANTGISLLAINAPVNASYQWIDCDNNFIQINGAINATFTPAVNGNYAVIVYDSICSDTSSCINYSTVGVINYSNELSVELYPNPSSDKLIIEINNLSAITTYILVDNLGRKLLQGVLNHDKTTMHLYGISSGIYFLQIADSSGHRETLKVIKE